MTIAEYLTTRSLTFSDSFSTGTLNANAWAISTGTSPSNAGEANGHFAANSVSLSLGCLQLRLTQNSSASLGGEISSVASFSYGLYEFTMRLASTSATTSGAGNAVSGGVSAGFLFVNNSETEIDVELEGQSPNVLEFTTWKTVSNTQASSSLFGRLSDGFHKYSMLWLPSSVTFYVNNLQTHAHTATVPSAAAHIFINHWGTDSSLMGGVRTNGVSRYLYCTNVSHYAD